MKTDFWHILDTGSIWLKEFASEFGKLVPAENWQPEIRALGYWESWEKCDQVIDPSLMVRKFPLQRGYARFPISSLLPYQQSLTGRLKRQSQNLATTGLICTAPFYAPVAELWPGPVVYYLTDLTKKYAGMNEGQIISLDKRMCRVAVAVCPNSTRIADYLAEEAGCLRNKITVIPNATRQQNILNHPTFTAGELPADLAHLKRPIVGVIGNLAGNMDWQLILEAIQSTPEVSWAFVGPTDMKISETSQHEARERVLSSKAAVCFTGSRPYGELYRYARCFDVAFLPYLRKEPTFSGSATRFYEHLAACRPIVATRGFHELLSKEPLLKLVDTSRDVAATLADLRSNNFADGMEQARWQASRQATWRVRATDLIQASENLADQKVA